MKKLLKSPLFILNVGLLVVVGLLAANFNIGGFHLSSFTKKTIAAIQTIMGVGAPNYLAAFDGTNSIGKSTLYETNDGKVGVGTTVPTEKMQIDGKLVVDDVLIASKNKWVSTLFDQEPTTAGGVTFLGTTDVNYDGVAGAENQKVKSLASVVNLTASAFSVVSKPINLIKEVLAGGGGGDGGNQCHNDFDCGFDQKCVSGTCVACNCGTGKICGGSPTCSSGGSCSNPGGDCDCSSSESCSRVCDTCCHQAAPGVEPPCYDCNCHRVCETDSSCNGTCGTTKQCIEGCRSNVDCPTGQECNTSTHKCSPVTVRNYRQANETCAMKFGEGVRVCGANEITALTPAAAGWILGGYCDGGANCNCKNWSGTASNSDFGLYWDSNNFVKTACSAVHPFLCCK